MIGTATSVNGDGRPPAGGWFRVSNDVVDVHGSRLGPVAGWVYVCLARHAGTTGYAFPSYDTIAREMGMGRRTVVRAIRTLESLGFVAVERQNDGRQSNRYRLLGGAGTAPVPDMHQCRN